jgi:predicted O-methyltransferase YrrM
MISVLQALNVALRHRPILSRMIELRHDPLIAWQGSLDQQEYGLLKLAVEQAATGPGPIIEIGTLFGFTTAMMASWMGRGRLITVDNYSWNPWGLVPEVHRALARRIMEPFTQAGRIDIVDMDSKTFFATYAGPAPSLVFIDGDHSYQAVRGEIEWAKKLGASIIGGHDYGGKTPGVIQAVDEHFPKTVTLGETVWMWGLKGAPV